MQKIRSAKKPIPVWATEWAARVYTAWKTYKNGERVEAIDKEVQAVLQIVADIALQVEAGQEMTDREFRLTRDLLDAHGRRIDDLTARVDRIDRDTQGHAAEIRVLHDGKRALERQGRTSSVRTPS